jgi:cytochrome c2
MHASYPIPRRRRFLVVGFLLVALMSFLLAGCGQSTDEAPFGSDDSAAPKTAAVVAAPAAKVATTAPTAVETAPPTEPPSAPATGGGEVDSAAAETLFIDKGCGACHVLSTVPGAVGTIGPALDGVASRDLIAGTLEVSLDNFKTWLENPGAVKPGTAMPTLGLPADDLDVLAAWLMTLE